MGAREEIPYRLRTHRTANMLLDLAPSKKMLYRYLAELREQNRAFVVGRTRGCERQTARRLHSIGKTKETTSNTT